MVFNIFISYSNKDKSQIEPVLQVIKSIQETNIFFAEDSIMPGMNISIEIIKAIKESDAFLVFYSSNSINSNYVQQEIGIAKANNKLIIPIMLDGTKPTAMLEGINYLDLSNLFKYNQELDRLYKFIKQNVERKKQSQGLLFLGALGLAYLALKNDK